MTFDANGLGSIFVITIILYYGDSEISNFIDKTVQ